MSQLVVIENGRPVTDSLTVAETFGRTHDNVLRDIRTLECSDEFSLLNFAESTYTNDRGRKYPKYIITEQGFAFLVMGYTGKEAARFKEMYIAEFGKMREQLNRPQQMTAAELIAAMANQHVMLERQQAEQAKRLEAVEKRMDDTAEILALNPTEWRKKVTHIINKIAKARGGDYQGVRQESYDLLEERAKCSLSIRLTNRKQKMALEGAAKSKIEKVSRVDVIADDARLTEIYLAIVKEMAIRYQVEGAA